jgi:hypothetical protein
VVPAEFVPRAAQDWQSRQKARSYDPPGEQRFRTFDPHRGKVYHAPPGCNTTAWPGTKEAIQYIEPGIALIALFKYHYGLQEFSPDRAKEKSKYVE